MRYDFFTILLAPCLALLGSAAAQESRLSPSAQPSHAALEIPGETLIPAATGVRSDSNGHVWNLDKNGSLGRVNSAMVNTGLILSINEQKFEAGRSMMTADGRELVITGAPLANLEGLQTARRVLLLEEDGMLRFLELFFNGSPNTLTLNIALNTSFSGNYKSTITDSARLEPILLETGETGLLVTPASSQAHRAFLFSLCSANAATKPSISSQSRYGLNFQYQVKLAPGETAALAHVVSQAQPPARIDAPAMTQLFEPYSLDAIWSTIPAQFRPVVANHKPSADDPSSTVSSFSSLGISPDASSDILAIGDQTRLLGRASLQPIELDTNFGKLTVDPASIAAISGKVGGQRERVTVFLNDGQVLTGQPTSKSLIFQMTGGVPSEWTFEKLDRLVLASASAPPSAAITQAIIRTWEGDEIFLDEAAQALSLVGRTPWGELKFSVNDLSSLTPLPGNQVGHEARLKNGTVCVVYMADQQLALSTPHTGAVSLNFETIRSIGFSQPIPVAVTGSYLRVKGEQTLVGEISPATIALSLNGQNIEVDPLEIRQISASADDSFIIQTRGGSQIDGRLVEKSLVFEVGDQQWKIPAGDIVNLVVKRSNLSDEQRSQIASLITQLGDDDWHKRESATVALAKLGDIATAMLGSELSRQKDLEVQRRIQRVLVGSSDSAQP